MCSIDLAFLYQSVMLKLTVAMFSLLAWRGEEALAGIEWWSSFQASSEALLST
ncbi:MAG: hypothetical protein JXB35_15055 [Anaerolineae bacterium]|nr:hypothetical protein [Anaerolineae bacterium]